MTPRILFVNPRYGGQDGLIILPLDQASAAAYARQSGYDVSVLDLAFEADDKNLEHILSNNSFDLIVLTCITICYRTAVEAAKLAKKVSPSTPIAIMGEHVTYRKEETLQRSLCFDFVISYEAEITSCKLVDALVAKKSGEAIDFADISGISYRQGDTENQSADTEERIVCNPDRKPEEDLDRFPPPAKRLYALEQYLARDHEATMITTRGCTHACRFCHRWRYGRRLRNWSLGRVFEEISENIKDGYKAIFFQDDVFCYDKERTRDFCEELINREMNIAWNCNVRIDDFDPANPEDEDLAKLMFKAGCYRIFVGIEAFDQELLDRSKKRAQVELIQKFVRLWQGAGVQVHASYIVGLPGDTEEKIVRRVELAVDLNTDLASFNRIFPHPGTPYGDNPTKWGLVIPDPYWYEDKYWWTKAVAGTEEMTPDKVYEMQQLTLTNYTESFFAEAR